MQIRAHITAPEFYYIRGKIPIRIQSEIRFRIGKTETDLMASPWEMPRDESEDTDITDDEISTEPKPKSKKNKVRKVVRPVPVNPSRWIRFLQWCESSNNLGYLQGILVLNSFLLYGLHSWFTSQYGQDPLTFISLRFIDAKQVELDQVEEQQWQVVILLGDLWVAMRKALEWF